MMTNSILKGVADLIYCTERVRRRFELNNPGEKVLAADASKGIVTTANQDIQRGFHWVTSQRAVIMLTTEKIICGKWTIPLESISTVQFLKIPSLFGSGRVLKIQTKDNTNYQFGMRMNPEWTNQQSLLLTLEEAQVKHSFYSIFARLLAVGFIIYSIYERFFAK